MPRASRVLRPASSHGSFRCTCVWNVRTSLCALKPMNSLSPDRLFCPMCVVGIRRTRSVCRDEKGFWCLRNLQSSKFNLHAVGFLPIFPKIANSSERNCLLFPFLSGETVSCVPNNVAKHSFESIHIWFQSLKQIHQLIPDISKQMSPSLKSLEIREYCGTSKCLCCENTFLFVWRRRQDKVWCR